MKEKYIEQAETMLGTLLATQPSLLAQIAVTPKGGEDLAEFSIAFIRRYSALLNQERNTSPASQPPSH